MLLTFPSLCLFRLFIASFFPIRRLATLGTVILLGPLAACVKDFFQGRFSSIAAPCGTVGGFRFRQ